mgnify:FL=1|tara:strand:- start:43 stop:930 length:888 start_codon:yes stop_codon:yes gene_type:complete
MEDIILSYYSVNPGAWVSIGIVFLSVFISWALNFSAPKVRVFGTLLAALGCFVIATWFFIFVMNSGLLENPKPNQTPLDSAKPTLLWIQSITAFLTGVFLLFIANYQRKSNEILDLSAKNEKDRYGRVSRLLHWTIAILFISLIPMGIFSSMIPEETSYRNAYYVVHKTIGVTVFLLVIVRLIWNKISKRPALDNTLTPTEKKLAHRAHNILYFMLLVIPITGFMMTSYHGYGTFFFFWELPPLWEQSNVYQIWGGFHKYLLPYIVYIILGAHVLGALKHQFIDKHDSAFKRMVS